MAPNELFLAPDSVVERDTFTRWRPVETLEGGNMNEADIFNSNAENGEIEFVTQGTLMESREDAFDKFGECMVKWHEYNFEDLASRIEKHCRQFVEQAKFEHVATRLTDDFEYLKVLENEARSWSLALHLISAERQNICEETITETTSPSSSPEVAMGFIQSNPLAKQLYKILQWLESCASCNLDLDNKVFGSRSAIYEPSQGLRPHTVAMIKSKKSKHLSNVDPDSTTRELGRLHPVDEAYETMLLEDVWALLQAGRPEEATQLCFLAGHPWRIPILGAFSTYGSIPSGKPAASFSISEKAEMVAVDVAGGCIGSSRRRLKWSCFRSSEAIDPVSGASGKLEAAVLGSLCSNLKVMLPVCHTWESACWSLVRSTLDSMIDQHFAANYWNGEAQDLQSNTVRGGMHSWPEPILSQIPSSLSSIFEQTIASASLSLVADSMHDKEHHFFQTSVAINGVTEEAIHFLHRVADESRSAVRRCDVERLRFAAHMLLLLRKQAPVLAEDSSLRVDDAVLSYTNLLLMKTKDHLVPLYASFLNVEMREEVCSRLLEERVALSFAEKETIMAALLSHLPFSGPGSVLSVLERALKALSRPAANCERRGASWREYLSSDLSRRVKAVKWLRAGLDHATGDQREILEDLSIKYGCRLFRDLALCGLKESSLGFTVTDKVDELLFRFCEHGISSSEVEAWGAYFTVDTAYYDLLNYSSLEMMAEEPQELGSASEETRSSLLGTVTEYIQGLSGDWLAQPSTDSADEGSQLQAAELILCVVLVSKKDSATSRPGHVGRELLKTAITNSIDPPAAGKSDHIQVSVDAAAADVSLFEIHIKYVPAVDSSSSEVLFDQAVNAVVAAAAPLLRGELPQFSEQFTGMLRSAQCCFEPQPSRPSHWTMESALVCALCRCCCLPDLVLSYMQIRVACSKQWPLSSSDDSALVQWLVSPANTVHGLFSKVALRKILSRETESLVANLDSV